ncbi:MAG: Bax inhibitor-1/YccA family protein [Oscillospiraceae bacterium]|nr:Bax inhibitor-1/YccA family protein [Oscillospiraceae bacterium]
MYDNYNNSYSDAYSEQQSFVLKRGLSGVFALMFVGLLISAAVAHLTAHSPAIQEIVFYSGMGSIAILFAPLLMVIFVFPRVWKMPPVSAVLVFFVYALLNGLTLSFVFMAYDLGTVAAAFFSAAAMFGVMAVYGGITKADLSKLGSLLIMGLFGFLIATLLNVFLFRSDMLDLLISYAGVAIFLGLTAYDVQRLKRAMSAHPGGGSAGLMVLGALHLYLDFLNIFLLLLRIMGNRRR